MRPDRGQVCFGGVPAKDFDKWSSISYMFQEDRLLPWRSALANVEFGLEARPIARKERRLRASAGFSWSGSPDLKTHFRISFPVACAAAWRWREAS